MKIETFLNSLMVDNTDYREYPSEYVFGMKLLMIWYAFYVKMNVRGSLVLLTLVVIILKRIFGKYE